MSADIKLTTKGRSAVSRVKAAYQALIDEGYTAHNAIDKIAWYMCADLPEGLVHFALDMPHGDSLRQMRTQGYAE